MGGGEGSGSLLLSRIFCTLQCRVCSLPTLRYIKIYETGRNLDLKLEKLKSKAVLGERGRYM